MSRLHIFAASLANIGAQFGVNSVPSFCVGSETSEGMGGMAVLEHEGRRLLRPMDWGFPRLTAEMKANGDEAGRIGLVANLTNPLWEHLVVQPRYRCLIPITHFANPDGVPGGKTRTWFSVRNQPIVAWAGFCRNIPGYGPVYAGMTMTANDAVEPTNDRMPVLLDPHQYELWFHGSIKDVILLQHGAPFAAERMVVERTTDLWRSDGLPASAQPQLALL